jgi:hypothetical protein
MRTVATVRTMTDLISKEILELRKLSTGAIREKWRDLFGKEAPHFQRQYLESRLAYRIQELRFGGLSPETLKRLAAIGEQLDGGNPTRRRTRIGDSPVVGTRFIREWHGQEYCVTVRHDGFEYQGKRYKSLSSIARAITGTQWNGWSFFGLRQNRGSAK